jgi:hypothetical protein
VILGREELSVLLEVAVTPTLDCLVCVALMGEADICSPVSDFKYCVGRGKWGKGGRGGQIERGEEKRGVSNL